MENTPWRLIFVATGSSLLLLILVFFVVLPKTSTPSLESGKIANLKNMHVSGHDKGRKVWEFYAESGYVDRDQRATILENVTNGTLYKDGDIITKNLLAPRVKANPNSKIVEAYSNEKKLLSAEIAFVSKGSSKKDRFANISAGRLTYNPDQKSTTLSDNIRIKNKEVVLRSNQMNINHDREVSDLTENIQIIRNDINLKCDSLHYDSKDERLEADGNVKSQIKAKQRTFLDTNRMILFIDDKKDVEAYGSVEVVQGKKAAVASTLVYNKSTKNILLYGGVKAIIQKGKALLKSDTIKKLDNPDAKTLLEEKTFITSDKLSLSTSNGDAHAEGKVIVSQKGREAKSNIADYSDKTEIITLTDNVYLKKEKAWIKCSRVEISVKDETFTAFGSIEAEFKLKK